MLALAAERAIEGILGIAAANLAHPSSPSVRQVRMCVPVGVAASITTAPLRLRSINVIHPVFFAPPPLREQASAIDTVTPIKEELTMKIQACGDFLMIGIPKRPRAARDDFS
jgi:hypothetical protein